MFRRLLPALVLFGVVACDDPAPGSSPVTDEVVDAGKADGSSLPELKVQAQALTVWMDPGAQLVEGPEGRELVLQGRASKNVASVASWTANDAFGHAEVVSARKFEVRFSGDHEINSVLSGMPVFVDLDAAVGRVRDYAIRVVVQPRFTDFAGSYHLWLLDELVPVYVHDEDPLRYQARVFTRGDAPVTVDTTGPAAPTAHQAQPDEWRFSWTYEGLIAAVLGRSVTFSSDEVRKQATGRTGSATVPAPGLRVPWAPCDWGASVDPWRGSGG